MSNTKEYILPNGKKAVFEYDITGVGKITLECMDELMGMIADRPQGEWKEKSAFHNADDNPIIEEWQSARCSVCGKYHTTPYLYYFDNFNFCPNCGSQMEGVDNDD